MGPVTVDYPRFLGQDEELCNLLDVESELANATDPAHDFWRLLEPGDWVRHEEIADLLLSHGASIETAHTWWSEGQWIWISCTGKNSQRDDPELVAAFLRCGADVNDRRRGKTPLHFASKAGFHRVMRVLLDAGADPNAPDADGLGPLHHALKAGKRDDSLRTVEMLLEAGGDANRADKRGHTPLAAARRSRRPDAAELLEAMKRAR